MSDKGHKKSVRCLFAERDCVYYLCRRHLSVRASISYHDYSTMVKTITNPIEIMRKYDIINP
jgi:hypothetical protein